MARERIKESQGRFELEIELKNFFKTKVDWKMVLGRAIVFELDDLVLDEILGVRHRGVFQRPRVV